MRYMVLLAALVLSGCGFQLRGGDVLPASVGKVYVEAPRDIAEELRIFLESSETPLVKSRDQADSVLSVRDESVAERVLSVDPKTGKEREFEITYRATFGLTRTAGGVLVDPQEVQLLRDYVYDRDAVLGASRERDVLRKEMRRDAVQQIMRRLRAALKT